MTNAQFTVALDGPAASGKGTIGRALAEQFAFAHLDTGLLYRAVGAKVAEGWDPLTAAKGLSELDLARDDLRSAEAGQAASRVAAIPDVRVALLDFQRTFASREGGAVLDGRDIGTVICPRAEAKLFVTAAAEVRAARRLAELVAQGNSMSFAEVLADVRKRDARDISRVHAPLKPADDAMLLDTSKMSIAEATDVASAFVEARRSATK
ncbi:MAG: (d)CMP kinase [Pseudomonadota bacterium]